MQGVQGNGRAYIRDTCVLHPYGDARPCIGIRIGRLENEAREIEAQSYRGTSHARGTKSVPCAATRSARRFARSAWSFPANSSAPMTASATPFALSNSKWEASIRPSPIENRYGERLPT